MRTRLLRWMAACPVATLVYCAMAAVLAAGFVPRAEGAPNTATSSGYWTNAATWSAGITPQASHDVVIPGGITVTNTGLATQFINSLTITGTLTHAANGNYPSPGEQHKIVMVVSNDLIIASGGVINVNGKGYAAGQGPGKGVGSYASGSHGGIGGRYSSGLLGVTYGAWNAPTNLGSGGATWGNGGGCVIFTVAGTTFIHGSLSASGTNGTGNGCTGSGGSVYLTTAYLSGSGVLQANGGSEFSGGGGGRVAVILTAGNDFGSVAMSAFGGLSGGSKNAPGMAGTVYRQTPAQGAGGGTLIVDNNGLAVAPDITTAIPTGQTWSVSNLVLNSQGILEVGAGRTLNLRDAVTSTNAAASGGLRLNGGGLTPVSGTLSITNWALIVDGAHSITGVVTVQAGGRIRHSVNTSNDQYRMELSIDGDLVVLPDGEISVDRMGFAAAKGPGAGTGTYASGSHGGLGGKYNSGVLGRTYGSITAPTNLGSGGYTFNGGGSARLTVSGTTTLHGVISAGSVTNDTSQGSSGSGGSILLTTAHLAGTGAIRANGGGGSFSGAGGGRVAVVLTAGSDFDGVTITAHGGKSGNGNPGGAGTVYRQTPAQGAGKGTVTLDNNGQTLAVATPIPPQTNAVSGELGEAALIVTNRAMMLLTASTTARSLSVAQSNDRLDLGAAGAVLTVSALSVNGMAYTRSGMYTTNDWNGYTPVPANVTGAGAIDLQARPAGALIYIR